MSVKRRLERLEAGKRIRFNAHAELERLCQHSKAARVLHNDLPEPTRESLSVVSSNAFVNELRRRALRAHEFTGRIQ
jgi:hypothetical protein